MTRAEVMAWASWQGAGAGRKQGHAFLEYALPPSPSRSPRCAPHRAGDEYFTRSCCG